MQCHHVDPTSPRLFKALKVSSRYSCHPSDGKPDKRPQTFMKCQFYWHEELECLVKVTENRRYRRETAAGNSNGASQVVLNHTTIIKTLTICFIFNIVKKSFSLNKRSSRNLGLLILYTKKFISCTDTPLTSITWSVDGADEIRCGYK